MAHRWWDSHGTPGNPGRYRQRCRTVLRRRSGLDNRAIDLRRWWRIADEPWSSTRNPVRVLKRSGTRKRIIVSCARKKIRRLRTLEPSVELLLTPAERL